MMEDKDLYFSTLVTKALHPIQGDDRFFEGYLTVEVKDKQGEITVVDELIKVLPIWMDRGAPISDTHSNRIIGKGISYAQTVYKDTQGLEYPAIKVTGKIHKNYELDDEIWRKIKSGEYKGMSFGGATKSNRTPKVMKDGSVAYELKNLEHYEVAVCKDPAVPLAVITDFNPIAKAMAGSAEQREDGKMVIQCDKFGCYVDKFANEQMHVQGQRGLGHDHAYHQNSGISSGVQTTEIKDNQTTEIKDTNSDKESERDKEGKQDPSTDGNNHGMYNQNVDPDTSSNRVGSDKDDIKKYYFYDKSGYQTEDGNTQMGAPSRGDKDTYKDNEIYINSKKPRSSNNMAEEEVNSKENEENVDEEKTEEEKVEKSFQETVKSNMEVLTDVITSLAETQKSVETTLGGIDNRLKALETPTDLPLKPKTSDKEDVGAKTTVPDDYQSNSRQTSLTSDQEASDGEKHPDKDEGGLKMQEKADHTFSTETPRPSALVEKSLSEDYSPILKDAREQGFEGLSQVARDILKGKYYQPTPEEVGQF